MSKLLVAALLPLAACTVSKSEEDYNQEIPLGDMRQGITIKSHVEPAVQVHLEGTLQPRFSGLIDQCFVLPKETTATLDGVPVPMSLGGYHWNTGDWGAHCDAIALSIDGMTHGSTLVIADALTTWTIEAHDLIGNDFVPDPTKPGTFTWQNVTTIDSALVYRGQTSSQDAQISGTHFVAPDAPGEITAVKAFGHTKPTRCEGPGTCTIELTAYRAL